MQAGRRYTLFQTLNWSRKYILIFILWSTVPVILNKYLHLEWTLIPWQPISLVGIAVAFYLGFKNNSSYERLWEGRKIWGGIVNTSRSFTVMVRDFVSNDEAEQGATLEELNVLRKELVHRHLAWVHALTIELRKPQKWENNSAQDNAMRKLLNTDHREDRFDNLKNYLNAEDYTYVLAKGNRSSHILSLQSKRLMELRRAGFIEHFRHLEIQALITEMFTLQGQSERLKKFPFPRQYASVNYFFVVLFVALLPFGMLDVFKDLQNGNMLWMVIPFSTVCMWVFWMMEMIGDSSENPFQGLYNDVPITSMATGIEIDIRQMLDETDLPDAIEPMGGWDILV